MALSELMMASASTTTVVERCRLEDELYLEKGRRNDKRVAPRSTPLPAFASRRAFWWRAGGHTTASIPRCCWISPQNRRSLTPVNFTPPFRHRRLSDSRYHVETSRRRISNVPERPIAVRRTRPSNWSLYRAGPPLEGRICSTFKPPSNRSLISWYRLLF